MQWQRGCNLCSTCQLPRHLSLGRTCRGYQQRPAGAAGAGAAGAAGRGGSDEPHAAPQVSGLCCRHLQCWHGGIHCLLMAKQPTDKLNKPSCPCSIVQFMGLVAVPPALITGRSACSSMSSGFASLNAYQCWLCAPGVCRPAESAVCCRLLSCRVLQSGQPVRLPGRGSRTAGGSRLADLAPPAGHGG